MLAFPVLFEAILAQQNAAHPVEKSIVFYFRVLLVDLFVPWYYSNSALSFRGGFFKKLVSQVNLLGIYVAYVRVPPNRPSYRLRDGLIELGLANFVH